MTPRPSRLRSAALLPLLATLAPAQFVQAPPRDGVSGTGTVVIERDAELMHVDVTLLAHAGTPKEALVALRIRGDQARQQLLGLGADPASITIAPAQLAAAAEEAPPAEEADAEKPKAGRAVRAQARLRAEWKLARKPHDEQLEFVHKLQKDVAALDLGGRKERQKLVEDEGAQPDEHHVEFSGLPGTPVDPGVATFFFSAEVPAAEHDKARTEAFRKATARAERLARAAGRTLGDLLVVQEAELPDGPLSWMQVMMMGAPAPGSLAEHLERRQRETDAAIAGGWSPGKVEHRVTISAWYAVRAK